MEEKMTAKRNRKMRKNGTPWKKGATVWGAFFLGLSISCQGWTYEVSQRANFPISYLSSFLGSLLRTDEEGWNWEDTGGEGRLREWERNETKVWVGEAGTKKGNKMREKNRERGGGRMRRLSRFPSNFSNLIKSCSVRKLNFVSTEYPVTTPYPLVRPSFVNAAKIRDEESDTVSYVLIYVGGWFDWLVGIAFRSSKVFMTNW